MEAQAHRFRVLCLESILHDLRPNTAHTAEFCDFLKKIRLRDEIKGEPGREGIDRDSGCNDFLDVSNAIGDRESGLLHSRRSRFRDMIAADVDWVIARQVF